MVEIKQKYWLYFIIAGLVITSFLIIRRYISPLLVAGAIAYILYPVHRRLSKKIRAGFSAFIITSVLFLSAMMFLVYGINFLLARIPRLYAIFSSPEEFIPQLSIIGIDNVANTLNSKVSQYVFSMASNIPHYAIAIFIFLVAFYYFLLKGPEIYKFIREIVPLSVPKKEKLFADIKRQINAIAYVQLVVGVVQGIAGGICLFLFGYDFPIVGAIIMAMLGIIPIIGPPIFYVPVAILSMAEGNYLQGLGLLLFGIFIISTIDNFIRPFLVGKKARVHPLIVIIGLFGGVIVFGVAGILVGPIILSITVTLIKDLEKFHIIE